jgi:phage shock protein C
MAAFCSACGGSLPEAARFCPACGKEVVGGTNYGPASVLPALVRPRAGRKVAGICRALANQYGWDITWTRVIAVLLIFFTFPIGLVAYGVFWLIMPEEPLAMVTTTSLNTVS